jgi:hypothetical protein
MVQRQQQCLPFHLLILHKSVRMQLFTSMICNYLFYFILIFFKIVWLTIILLSRLFFLICIRITSCHTM